MVSLQREYVDKDVTIDYTENVDIDKNLNSTVYIDGNFAFAEAAASAYGNDTVAQAITFTYSDDNSSTASATSVSGTN